MTLREHPDNIYMTITIKRYARLSEDARGYTANYYHDRIGEQLILFRKAGTVSGRHYHKGRSLSKNPEVFMLLSGTCTINWRGLADTALHTTEVTGPARLDIPAYVWHELIMETDCTCLEFGSIADHDADTFYIT